MECDGMKKASTPNGSNYIVTALVNSTPRIEAITLGLSLSIQLELKQLRCDRPCQFNTSNLSNYIVTVLVNSTPRMEAITL